MVGPNLHVYNEAIFLGSLGEIINKGNIKFIPKAGYPEVITNWRPITLLNVRYKIISKATALKLRPILPLVIRLEQIGFFKGRYILDNVITVWEGMKWAQNSIQEALFIRINFEKSYDRIEWNFILAMLKDLGFGPLFLHSVQILFRNASSILTMNGSQYQAITLAHFICQRCPLAPSLFMLETEAFTFFWSSILLKFIVRVSLSLIPIISSLMVILLMILSSPFKNISNLFLLPCNACIPFVWPQVLVFSGRTLPIIYFFIPTCIQ